MTQRLALSVGEPAGIGPDLAVLAAQRAHPWELLAFADPALLAERAHLLGLPLRIVQVRPGDTPAPSAAGALRVVPHPLVRPATPGRLDPDNAAAVLAALDAAAHSCARGEAAALVTGPLHKAVINEAGIAFTGHTEHLARLTAAATPVMLLVAGTLRVALVTTHLPLAAVPAAVTQERVERVLTVLVAGLERDFGIAHPRILVLGLNPHAGEDGHLGTEEETAIRPAVDALIANGVDVSGPLAADTAFVPEQCARADAVLAMYHDQGLPVLKRVGFGNSVNVTLGLPIVRASVDHGTALDRAATGRVDAGSLLAALDLAAAIAARRAGNA